MPATLLILQYHDTEKDAMSFLLTYGNKIPEMPSRREGENTETEG
ncbi:MAG: hypothetical protein AB2L14_27755 [Candidatus Xenobiia bacterium LiM19]